jgi:hypothetical protein
MIDVLLQRNCWRNKTALANIKSPMRCQGASTLLTEVWKQEVAAVFSLCHHVQHWADATEEAASSSQQQPPSHQGSRSSFFSIADKFDNAVSANRGS